MNQDTWIERVLDESARHFGMDRSRCTKCRPTVRPVRCEPHPGNEAERRTKLRRPAD